MWAGAWLARWARRAARRPRGRSLVRGGGARAIPSRVLRGRLEALGPGVRGGRSRRRGRCCSQLEAEGSSCARASTAAQALVRPPPAGAHPPLHARPAAPGDRAGHRRGVPAFLACWQHVDPPRASTGRAACAEVVHAARRLRDPGRRVGGERAARARARLQARVARPAHARRRGRGLGAAVGIGRPPSGARRSRSSPRDQLVAWPRSPPRWSARAGLRRGRRGARGAARARRRVRAGAGARPAAARSPSRWAGRAGRRGRVTCDSFARAALAPAAGRRRRRRRLASGRWSLVEARRRAVEPDAAHGRRVRRRAAPRRARAWSSAARWRARAARAVARHRASLPDARGARRDRAAAASWPASTASSTRVVHLTGGRGWPPVLSRTGLPRPAVGTQWLGTLCTGTLAVIFALQAIAPLSGSERARSSSRLRSPRAGRGRLAREWVSRLVLRRRVPGSRAESILRRPGRRPGGAGALHLLEGLPSPAAGLARWRRAGSSGRCSRGAPAALTQPGLTRLPATSPRESAHGCPARSWIRRRWAAGLRWPRFGKLAGLLHHRQCRPWS